MRVSVDPELCEANGVCVGLAPNVFTLDEDEMLHIHEPADDDIERVSKAVSRCPKGALRIESDS